MILVPYHPILHGDLMQSWAQDKHWFVEPPDQCKPMLTFIVMLGEKPVGSIQAFNIDLQHKRAEVGIGFADKAGLRVAWQTCLKMAEILFDQMGLNRLYCRLLDANQNAVRLMERLGFVMEGRERQAVMLDGEYHDTVVWGLLREDYRRGL
jgi:RimJ/RimL family protein N-acetyltransferase